MLIPLDHRHRNMLEKIGNALDEEELIGQLCEECGELVQALQKYRRAIAGTTAVSLDDARVRLNEECADVLVCIAAICVKRIVDEIGVLYILRYKLDRWFKRVFGGGEHNESD